MAEKKPLTVDDAYSLHTPADSIRLYAEWASTYDSGFVAATGYVLYQQVVRVLLQQQSEIHGAVLDIGCGTGVVGVELRVEIPIYLASRHEHANDKAYVVVCRVVK